ncbi:hypothetical protein M0813_12231 [Anaeramoeba flamelloides]|uniref:Uncharacterized protein n=1 Tax=Anaeramoeba flamelloides TaxID=1746091 RepID=A0ABQ8ZCL1_9EUKA|nr:hypothetical protein M0813_12231 [Anaeramoeba flamelloides]
MDNNEGTTKEFGFSLEKIQKIFEKYQRDLNRSNIENRKLSKENQVLLKQNEELEQQIYQSESRSNQLSVTLKKLQKENQKLNLFKKAILQTINQQNNHSPSRNSSRKLNQLEETFSMVGTTNKEFFEMDQEEEIDEEDNIFENKKKSNHEMMYSIKKTRNPRYSTNRSEKEIEQFEMKTPIKEQTMSETDELLDEIEKSISKSHKKQNTRRTFIPFFPENTKTKPKYIISQTEPRQKRIGKSGLSKPYRTRKNLFNKTTSKKRPTNSNSFYNSSDLLSKAREDLSYNDYNSLLKIMNNFNSGQITKSTAIEKGSVLLGHNNQELLNQFLSNIN